ncbi:hypothetical protein SteCoe_37643 [Stentor coeruleus]|uniref:EamA domain-containing protein n=1 Tax=Stentor coeruleus TaxID=5963 RepID=A0A1R2AML8_9CILI|nr:hypothetical protein SteCoe_37643 [Stentor coeruleus]
MNAKKFNLSKNLVFLGIIAASCASTILSGYSDAKGFSFPILQTCIMCFSESLCIIPALYDRKKRQKNLNIRSTIINPVGPISNFAKIIVKLMPCLAGLCDVISSALVYIAYIHLETADVVSTGIFNMFYILLYKKYIQKRKTYIHQKIGIVILILGTLGLTLNFAFFSGYKYEFSLNRFCYLLLMLFGALFSVLHLIIMEYTMKIQGMTPCETVAFQGLSCLLISSILYIPANYIYYNSYSSYYLAAPFLAFKSNMMIGLIISSIVVIFWLNYFVAKGVKLTDSLAVCTLEPGKSLIIWIIFIIINDNHIRSSEWINLGFSVILVIGMLIYNEVVIFPCGRMKKSALRSIRENEAYREAKLPGRAWQFKLEGLIQ